MKYLVAIFCLLLAACTIGGCVYLYTVEPTNDPRGNFIYFGLGLGALLFMIFAGNVLGFKGSSDDLEDDKK